MNYTKMSLHPLSERIVDILTIRLQNYDRDFFRVEVAYHLAKLASNMHVTVQTPTGTRLPVNMFAIAFAESGYGKNHSKNILETEIFQAFEDSFLNKVFPNAVKKSIAVKALQISNTTGEPAHEIEEELEKDFNENGHFLYEFPEGTSPALKQLGRSIKLAGAGAASLEMDELGSNLSANHELLSTLLELYDVGITKEKLLKVTKDSKRARPIKGLVPSNVFAFGTPVTVFDGGKVEEEFRGWCKTGYARRSLFAYGDVKYLTYKTPEEILKELSDPSLTTDIKNFNTLFGDLADEKYLHTIITVPEETELLRIEYQEECKKRSSEISEYRSIERVEMAHRHIKALKLAATYTFIRKDTEMSIEDLENAISLTELSGFALIKTLNQPRNYVRLAKFLGEFGRPVTEADLMEYLPFYSGSVSQKKDLINLAKAYGYQNAIAITSYVEADVMFHTGTTLIENDNSKITLSTSTELASAYVNTEPTPEQFINLLKTTKTELGFCNHHLIGGDTNQGERRKANIIMGTNTIVFDVDSTKTSPEHLHNILGNFNHIIYTTKQHTDENPRYRLIMFLSHYVALEDIQYKDFAKNIAYWLPVNVDIPCIQRERKYRIYPNSKVFHTLDAENLSVMPYYPNTQQAIELINKHGEYVNLKGIQRWVIHTAVEGNRNNTVFRLLKVLQERNLSDTQIRAFIEDINNKLQNPLTKEELEATIYKSLNRN